MPNVNQLVVCGNLTRDITMKYTQGGMAIAEIGICVNNRVKRNDEWTDDPVFLDCTAFGKTAEFANDHLSKGAAAVITGKISMDQWTDKQTGAKRSKLKVIADTVIPCASFKGSGQRQQQEREPTHASSSNEPFPQEDGDTPF